MNILLLASHAVAEYDDIRMFTDMGHDVFCPGGYETVTASAEGIRPALPERTAHPELVAACNKQRETLGEPGNNIDWAKAQLHDDVIDWADVIIAHHFVDRWLVGQWGRIKHKRVIWRTCGQSDARLELLMRQLDGLQIVRYSPAEERHFSRLGVFAGQDALIRFGKYPDDYGPWLGDVAAVGNITQHMKQRGDACGYEFWKEATSGLIARPAGPGSDVLPGGTGSLDYYSMLTYLTRVRAYLYTGTRPASYTLGLIEAMLSGVPVVSIGAHAWGRGWDGDDLFEADSISGYRFDEPDDARQLLQGLLDHPDTARVIGESQRKRAIEMFGIDTISAQWDAFLS